MGLAPVSVYGRLGGLRKWLGGIEDGTIQGV